MAEEMRRDNTFAYRKWELERNNSVHAAMLAYLERPATVARVAALLGTHRGLAPRMGDFFVTLYRQGDFLSAHSDIYGGTFATVVHLAEGPAEKARVCCFPLFLLTALCLRAAASWSSGAPPRARGARASRRGGTG